MTALAFDTLKFARRLRETAGFTREHAEAAAEAFAEAVGESDLATKADLGAVKGELKADIAGVKSEVAALRAEVKADLRDLENRMTIKLGGMLVVLLGILFAGARYVTH